MDDFNDYYEILGISRDATDKDIKKAYIDKCFILHPDRLQGAPESAKKRAEQELVIVNKAYEVLKDTSKRHAYDKEWVVHENKPNPVVEPLKIEFKNVRPGEIRSASFVIRNTGGPYSNISIPNPETWVRLTKWQSLSTTDELPLQVSVEVEGASTGNKFNETIKIKLDNEEAQLPVMMRIRKESRNPLGRIFKEKKGDAKNKRKKESNYKIPNWLTALLFIFSFSLVGVGISYLLGNLIPLVLMLGFSLIFSIQKWFYYYTRKHKSIGKSYRLFLNLSILSVLGLTIWSGIELFSQQFLYNPLIGSLIFLIEIVFFIWLWRIVAKNSWRWPSMKLTVFSLICLFIIFAFAGVQPMSSYKDKLFSGLSDTFNNVDSHIVDIPDDIPPTISLDSPNIDDPQSGDINPVIPSTESKLSSANATPKYVQDDEIDYNTGEYKNYYLGLVRDSSGIVIGGNGCYDNDGNFIVLINSKNAKNPTYSELLDFLRSDKTEEFIYQLILPVGSFYYGSAKSNVNLDRIQNIIDNKTQPDSPKVCADFAERLHNNAEKAGIRCGYVLGTIHSFNVFETTDKGLVYIDDTGTSGGLMSFDCEAFIDSNRKVRLQPLFPEDKSEIASITYVGDDVYYETTVWEGDWN